MKKSQKQPSRPAPKPALKALIKVAQHKTAPSLVDVKNLVGQMKGMLTWMSKERTELQNMMAQVQAMIASLSPAGSAEAIAETMEFSSDSAGTRGKTNPDAEAHKEHGDPVVPGAFSHRE